MSKVSGSVRVQVVGKFECEVGQDGNVFTSFQPPDRERVGVELVLGPEAQYFSAEQRELALRSITFCVAAELKDYCQKAVQEAGGSNIGTFNAGPPTATA